MKTHLIELTDRTEHTIVADRWEVENDKVMNFYKGDEVIYSKRWRDILFIYSHKEEHHEPAKQTRTS